MCRIGSLTLPQFAAATVAMAAYFVFILTMNARATRSQPPKTM